MSRDYPTLDEQYGPGAERADAEAQDDIVADLEEAIASPSEYNHRYWCELADRAVEKLNRPPGRCECDAFNNAVNEEAVVWDAAGEEETGVWTIGGVETINFCPFCGRLVPMTAHSGETGT